MLDLRWIRAHPEEARRRLASRGAVEPLDEVLRLDEEQRARLAEVEALRAQRNQASLAIRQQRQQGAPTAEARERARAIAAALAAAEPPLRAVEHALTQALQAIPNIPHPEVPVGHDETANRVVETHGAPTRPEWVRPHWEVGRELGILDLPGGSRLAAARFPLLIGAGAALQRALTQLMLALAEEDGFTEVAPPLLANADALTGSGHLPKFAADLFRTQEGLALIPTAEVPLVNLHRGEMLAGASLPRRYVAATPCFRGEAGAPGRETHGLIRLHQFEKVERVSFTRPEESTAELARLTQAAARVLQRLAIPHRVVELCTGELGFAAARTFDVEAWFPALGRYLEVSSCSDCGDFQARRLNTRFRDEQGRPRFVHTLNASGLAVGRTLAAVLENCQREDGTVVVPEALRNYCRLTVLGERRREHGDG